jgi:hypothetical protein
MGFLAPCIAVSCIFCLQPILDSGIFQGILGCVGICWGYVDRKLLVLDPSQEYLKRSMIIRENQCCINRQQANGFSFSKLSELGNQSFIHATIPLSDWKISHICLESFHLETPHLKTWSVKHSPSLWLINWIASTHRQTSWQSMPKFIHAVWTAG